ncbi:MAG: glucose-6-phosphate dehydrogenase assembly protein OpcA [Candidatus Baltobacteraceae bacterium]
MDQTGAIVNVSEIKRSLDEARCGGGLARTTMMNLIVYTNEPEREEWVAERVEGIAKKYPARIILLDGTSLGDPMTASVQPQIGGGAQSEIVRFGIEDCAPQTVRSLLDALTIPDVPEVLWWNGSTIGVEQLFEELARFAAPAIIDSSGSSNDVDNLRELIDLAEALGSRPPIDLAYLRIRPVQEVLAGFFDDPTHRAQLASIDRLEIDAGSLAEAIYLRAWLGRVLERPFEGGASALTRKGQVRRVARCLLASADCTYEFLFDEPTHCAHVTASIGRQRHSASLPFVPLDTMSLVEKALLSGRIAPHYREILAIVTAQISVGAP